MSYKTSFNGTENNFDVTCKRFESCHFHLTCDDLKQMDLCDRVSASPKQRPGKRTSLRGHFNRGVNVLFY